MPKDQVELREIVRRAVGNKVRKLNTYILQVEAQSNRWKLKYKALHGQVMTDQWRPIKSAPKNGDRIDVWVSWGARPSTMGWADSFRVTEAWWQDQSPAGWYHLHEGKPTQITTEYVTHWMPLPEPPPKESP